MTTYGPPTLNGIEKRTRRACEESMTVVPRGEGTGLFDVHSGTNPEPYVVDLAAEHDRCTCPDVQHNLLAGERCKHIRRVRLEFGLVPFEDVPEIRDEHAALTDVELARQARGVDVDPEPEPEPEPITVSGSKPARRVATDGGMVVSEPVTWGESGETGCSHDHPDCEGADADVERSVLCWDCWEVWAS